MIFSFGLLLLLITTSALAITELGILVEDTDIRYHYAKYRPKMASASNHVVIMQNMETLSSVFEENLHLIPFATQLALHYWHLSSPPFSLMYTMVYSGILALISDHRQSPLFPTKIKTFYAINVAVTLSLLKVISFETGNMLSCCLVLAVIGSFHECADGATGMALFLLALLFYNHIWVFGVMVAFISILKSLIE